MPMCTFPMYINNTNNIYSLSNNSFHCFMSSDLTILELIWLWSNSINNVVFDRAEFSSFWYQPWQEYFIFHYSSVIAMQVFLLNEWRRAFFLSFWLNSFDFLYSCEDFHHSFVLPVCNENSISSVYSMYTFMHVLEKETYTLSISDN